MCNCRAKARPLCKCLKTQDTPPVKWVTGIFGPRQNPEPEGRTLLDFPQSGIGGQMSGVKGRTPSVCPASDTVLLDRYVGLIPDERVLGPIVLAGPRSPALPLIPWT
jgi:hypothetical protein